MTTSDWWLPSVGPVLEQGDLIQTRFSFQLISPVKYLSKGATGKGGKQLWEESNVPPHQAGDEHVRVVSSIAGDFAMVLSFGCEIDKANSPVLLAPVSPLTKLPLKLHDDVLAQRAFRYFPLVELPGIGFGYANLAKTFSLQQALIKPEDRIKSMTPDGIFRVQAQLVGFYTRLNLPAPAPAPE